MRPRRPVSAAAALLLLALPGAASHAQREAEVRRGEVKVLVKVTGTVVAEDLFRLKSSIDGRVEAVLASTNTWAGSEGPLGLLANSELAALMDSRQTTPSEVLEERWQKVYQPTQIRCPGDCYILRVYAQPKRKVLPQAVLFEAARTLRLVGRVRPEDRGWVQDGQSVEFWPVARPAHRQTTPVERFVLDVQGAKVDPGGTFTSKLGRKRYLDPGTAWEGVIAAKVKKNALHVPTNALIRFKDSTYLAVRVSTGITTAETTEIAAGIDEKRPILILDPADLGSAEPHFPSAPPVPAPAPRTSFDDMSTPEAGRPRERVFDDSRRDRPAGDDDE